MPWVRWRERHAWEEEGKRDEKGAPQLGQATLIAAQGHQRRLGWATHRAREWQRYATGAGTCLSRTRREDQEVLSPSPWMGGVHGDIGEIAPARMDSRAAALCDGRGGRHARDST
jgi:hypothetical protein